MDAVNIRNYIEAWLANNAGRANSMSMQTHKIIDEIIEICIDGKVLQIGIPHNFYTNCSSDGSISNANSAFVGTLANAKPDESNSIELVTALNEKFDRLNSRGFYAFSSVLDSVVDAFEKYKSSSECDWATSEIDDEEEDDGWSTDGEAANTRAIGLKNNYFDQLIDEANKRCDQARSVVMPCDENIRHGILSLFGFEVLGLGAQVLQEVVRMPLELIDLEISIASAAANGSRDVFEPFPPFLLLKRDISQIANPKAKRNQIANPNADTNSMSICFNKNKNMVAMRNIIKSIPSVREMRLSADEAELKAMLAKSWLSTTEGESAQKLGEEYFGKEVWQLPYNVLRFILSTNTQSFIFLSEDDDKILKHSQFHQFAVVQDTSDRDAVSTSRNKHEVSRFGFHGSPSENWYSILRNGLRCLSNTKLMSTGNRLGDGIYLANSFAHSALYSTDSTGDHWMNGMYKKGFYVVSICEVIPSSSIKECLAASIFVVPKEHQENLAVRYLLVYDHKLSPVETRQARISDGHILSHSGHNVDLSEHYERIRQKYASDCEATKVVNL